MWEVCALLPFPVLVARKASQLCGLSAVEKWRSSCLVRQGEDYCLLLQPRGLLWLAPLLR